MVEEKATNVAISGFLILFSLKYYCRGKSVAADSLRLGWLFLMEFLALTSKE